MRIEGTAAASRRMSSGSLVATTPPPKGAQIETTWASTVSSVPAWRH